MRPVLGAAPDPSVQKRIRIRRGVYPHGAASEGRRRLRAAGDQARCVELSGNENRENLYGATMNHVDLFSGIGGFALAARWAGLETVQFVEIDPFCRKVLQKNFKGVPIHDDIKTFDGTKYPNVFLLTGGFPCQPFSCAGKQRGTNDDRYLWPEMLRVISEVRPCWIIGENVAGINSLFQYDSFSEMEGKEYLTPEDAKADFKGISERTGTNSLWVVLDDLEKIGYSVQTCIIPACAVNAPHRRDRVWICAHAVNGEYGTGRGQDGEKDDLQRVNAANTESKQLNGCWNPRERREGFTDGCGSATHAGSKRLQGSEWLGSYEQRQAAHGSVTERNHAWDEPWIEAATRLCRVDDGLPRQVDRVNRLTALGNAIVPQVAYEIMKNIVEVEVTK